MKTTEASAPGKVILFGEHAVVYGRPAIAAPVSEVRARAVVEDSPVPGVILQAPDLGRSYDLQEAAENDPFARAIHLVIAAAGTFRMPDLIITVRSAIPIASGLGSGAAMASAVIRALANHLGIDYLATDEWVSNQTYEVEKLLHGTPSGIDNTVVSYEMPLYFIRREPSNVMETFIVARPLRFLIADTGFTSSTREVVGDVRRMWEADRARFELLFDKCGQIAESARQAIVTGKIETLGDLMYENHTYLREMAVSSPELDKLVGAAELAGALGAKMSGAGRGGNIIALVTEDNERIVRQACLAAGAKQVFSSSLT
ncbi:MAG: mevalonate kinase [Candidatus Promineifilaceae bacterium]